jgi:hypothetical protein
MEFGRLAVNGIDCQFRKALSEVEKEDHHIKTMERLLENCENSFKNLYASHEENFKLCATTRD